MRRVAAVALAASALTLGCASAGPRAVDGPLPVMVFVHGGAFTSGGGAPATTHGGSADRA